MPGAGSLRAVNYLYNTAPKDGTALGIFARDMPLLGIIGGNSNVRFDVRKLTWLGSSSSYANDAYFLFVRKDAQVKSIEDARRPGGPPIVLGGTAEGATGNDIATVVRDALGLNIKLIAGYPDSNALFLAVDRKELDGRFVGLSATSSSHPEWLTPKGGMQKLLQFARVTRHPQFPDIPTARELALNDRSRALIALAELPYRLSRPFAAPPGVPDDRAKALQKAFLDTQEDPQYLAEAAKLQVDISPIGGAEVLGAIEEIAGAPPELLEYMKKLLAANKGGG
jgi:tripartite-type tricarboxylate transporter receptor subunit TctC